MDGSGGHGQAALIDNVIPTCCASASAGGCARFLMMTGFALLGLAAAANFLGPIGLGPTGFAVLSLAEGNDPTCASEGAC